MKQDVCLFDQVVMIEALQGAQKLTTLSWKNSISRRNS